MLKKYGITSTEFEVIDAANTPNWMKSKDSKIEKKDESAEEADEAEEGDKE